MYFFIPLINLILLEFSFKFPTLIYFSGFILLVLTFYSIYRWLHNQPKHTRPEANFWLIYSAAAIFILSFIFLLIFLENKTLIHSLIILESFALFVFLYIIYHIFKTEKIKLNYAAQNLVGYFNLAAFFFLTADLLFLDLNTTGKFFYFFIFFAVAVFGLAYISLKIYNIFLSSKVQLAFLYLAVLEIIMLEFFWLLGYLPIAVYTRAGLLALFFYFILGIFKHYLVWGMGEITFKVVKRYVLISSLGVALLLATARWQ